MTGCSEPAPAPPPTDIHLARIEVRGDHFVVERPLNVTDRPGYDNQPVFLADGTGLLYTSIRADGQADIYRYDLASRVALRVTRTFEDEYSPTPRPDGGFSVVRVEEDGKQRLWGFDATGGSPELLLEEPDAVGYHAWGDETTVALFVLGEPPTLQLARVDTGKIEELAVDVGRSLHKIPGRRSISFVDKRSEQWWIRELDVETGEVAGLIRAIGGDCEDYTWTPDGHLLMPCGSRLYLWRPGLDEDWRQVADLADIGLDDLTRVAVSPRLDRLAVVAGRGAGG